jgi:hypothetical protein
MHAAPTRYGVCRISYLALGALVLLCTGCVGGRPNWFQPGTAVQQQRQATVHDPYTDNNAGPEVAGLRPRSFEKPDAEPVRSQRFRDTRWPF